MKNQMIIITVLVAIVFAGAGFFAGMQYQKPQRTSFVRRLNNNQNNAAIRGQILSGDANSITIKLADGSSKIVVFGTNTIITEAATASKSALMQGKQVTVMGTTNSDGSVTAADIQLC